MTQSSLSDYSRDDRRAGQLVGVVQQFVDAFIARQAGGQLRRLLDGEQPEGVVLEQSPAELTRRDLVEPCLDALGYPDGRRGAVDGPHRRREPSRYPAGNRPAYELRGIDDRLTCLVEVAAINRERRESPGAATEAVTDSLADEGVLEAVDHDGVLAAIGTDGLQWTLWLADLETGRIHEAVTRGSIVDPIADVVAIERPDGLEGAEARHRRITARKRLESRLVRGFSVENLGGQVGERVGRWD